MDLIPDLYDTVFSATADLQPVVLACHLLHTTESHDTGRRSITDQEKDYMFACHCKTYNQTHRTF